MNIHRFLLNSIALLMLTTVAYLPQTSAQQFEFKNDRQGLQGNRLDHFVDFSLKYDTQWTLTPRRDDKLNFITLQIVDEELRNGNKNCSEQFCIGTLNSYGPIDEQFEMLKELASQFVSQFSSALDDFEMKSESRIEILGRDAYEFRASFIDQFDQKAWMRIVFIPQIQGNAGVTFMMLANESNTGISGVDGLGTQGQLPRVLASIKFEE